MSGFYEFFAGGGMVRAGLGPGWSCPFANDIDPKKAASYARNWGDAEHQIHLYEMGWNMLVIWEYEMKELGAVRSRIRVFLEGAPS